jgi:hypothetical protein
VGNWNDGHEDKGRALARTLNSYLLDIAPGFGVPYEGITDWTSREGLLLVAACRLLCRRGTLRLEMREAAKIPVPGEAVTNVVGRFFDAMTIDERRGIEGLHFTLDESKWRVNIELRKDPNAPDHPADAAGPGAGPGDLPHGPDRESGPEGLHVPGAEPATEGDRGAGKAAEAPLLSPPGEG